MEANLSEYITEYYATDYYKKNDNYDEICAEKEDRDYEDRIFEELNKEEN